MKILLVIEVKFVVEQMQHFRTQAAWYFLLNPVFYLFPVHTREPCVILKQAG